MRVEKSLSLALLAAAIALAPDIAKADAAADFYKGKIVKIVIGASMGGSYGLFAQFAGRHIPKFLPGAPTVVVQPMPGGGGNKSMSFVYSAAPQDGSVVMLPQLTVVQESLFNDNIHFDAAKFKYIGRFTDITLVATASGSSGVKDVDGARRKVLNAGSVGRRNSTFMGPVLMNDIAGTKFKMISGYRGTTQSYQALEHGEIDLATTSWITLNVAHAGKLKSGALVPIFAIATKRHPDLPNVPTVVEFGKTPVQKAFLDIYTVSAEIGRTMAGPPHMPDNLVAAWRTAFDKMVRDPAFVSDVTKRKARLNPLTGQQITDVILKVMTLPRKTIVAAKGYYNGLLRTK